MEDVVYPLQEPMVFKAYDIVPHEMEKPTGKPHWMDIINTYQPLDDGWRECFKYPRYHGNGVYELAKGVFASEKFVEEVNQAILDEVSNEEADEKG